MPELTRCFEDAGFSNVRTILSSGNVAFNARSASDASIERKAESSMQALLGRTFFTIVRQSDALLALLETDPFAAYAVSTGAKRVVTFVRAPITARVALPLESDGARVLSVVGREAFTVYMPSEKGPVFMKLIEKAFGIDVTTRTWETVRKCAAA
jgi:uncharacterized protein (DUF1697 family)